MRLSTATGHLLHVQQNIVATWQLDEADRRALRHAVRRKRVQEVTYRVFASSNSDLTMEQKVWAAVLHCGPHARVGGRNALVLHGWRGELQTPIDVVVPTATRPHKPPVWARVRRLRLPGFSHLHPARVGIHDAAVQAAMWAQSDRQALFLLLSTLQQRLTTADHVLAHVPPTARNRAVIVATIEEYRDGIQSTYEHEFASLCRKHGLPPPARQTPIRDANGKIRSIDVEFRVGGHVLRVEIEGAHHLNPDAWLDDIDRHNDIVLTGEVPYLRVATITLRLGPEAFFQLLRNHLHLPAVAA